MAKAIFSPRAEQDLRDIWRAIAAENEAAAHALLLRILDKTELAASQPRMGSPRPELSASARLLVEGRYVIIYEPMSYGVFVVTIVHGARDIENWLS